MALSGTPLRVASHEWGACAHTAAKSGSPLDGEHLLGREGVVEVAGQRDLNRRRVLGVVRILVDRVGNPVAARSGGGGVLIAVDGVLVNSPGSVATRSHAR